MAILGLNARALEDRVTTNFCVGELTDYRGWWPEDVEGDIARYHNLCTTVLEPARAILGNTIMRVVSGSRPIGHNEKGRASSMHLPPIQRADAKLRFQDRPVAKRGAAADFIPVKLDCDRVFWILDEAQRSGKLPPGGLFWYPATKSNPGSVHGRFIHIDDRGFIARERALTAPKVA